MKAFGILVGILAALVLIALMALGFAVEAGFLPSAEVFTEDTLPESYLETLRKENIIDDDETVDHFYSSGILSILEDGNLFTDKRVVSYETYNDELAVYSAPFEDIQSITMTAAEDFFGYSEITVTTDDDGFLLFIDNAENMDNTFYEALMAAWEPKRSTAVPSKPKSTKK